MRYIYYAKGIVELFYEKPGIKSSEIIEVPDDFELDPNMIYSVDPDTKEIVCAPREKNIVNKEVAEEQDNL